MDEDELRRAGPLPDWSLRRSPPARLLGPELTWLVDGLAAHLASIAVQAEPNATWFVADDAYLGRAVAMLQLPGRSRVPFDDIVAELVRVLQGDRSHIELATLDSFVDYVLAYGDPRPRSYEDQTAKEARALLVFVASGSGASVDQFLEAVESAGGPLSELDFSRDSLVPLWTWLTSRPIPPTPIPDPEMRRHELPWWYEFSGRLAGQSLGPEVCWLATGAADYLAAMVFRELPGSSWRLGSERIGADFREPLLRVDGDGERNIHDQMARLIKMADENDDRARGPNVLRSMFDQWLAWARRPPEPEPVPEPDYSIGHMAPSTPFARVRSRIARRLGLAPTYTGGIMFSESAAHVEDRRIDRFVHLLEMQPRVERAFREDREIVYVVAPDMSAGELEATIDRAWIETAPRPRGPRRPAAQTDDPSPAVT